MKQKMTYFIESKALMLMLLKMPKNEKVMNEKVMNCLIKSDKILRIEVYLYTS